MGAKDNDGSSEFGNASKEAEATLVDENQTKSTMSNRKVYKNLLLVTAAFLLNMGSYMTLEGLQSSLNADAGTTSVAAVYTAFVLTSFFLPSLAMEFLKSRKAMVLGTIPYALYSVANCFPQPYTLIPAGILLGAGASVVWSANRVYISDISAAYARRNNRDEGKTKQMLATAKFLVQNHSAKALIPITIHVGVLQGYAFGQFTKYWVTCVIGIEFVGYVASMFGIGSTLGGYGSGYLAQHAGRFVIMVVAWFVEMALMVFLLIWEPEVGEKALFFITFAVFGILHATYKTILTTATTLFFSSTKEAASASLSIWDPLGSAIAYAISTTACNRIYTICMMVLVTIGTLFYLLIERNFKKSEKAKGDAIDT